MASGWQEKPGLQVRKIEGSQRGQSGAWKYRDHGLFVFYAPTDNPRYAGAVVIEHGLGGARAAAPVARDILTYAYDPAKAMETLTALESGWGGDIKARSATRRARLRIEAGIAPVTPEMTLGVTNSNASEVSNAGNRQTSASNSTAIADTLVATQTVANASVAFEDEP